MDEKGIESSKIIMKNIGDANISFDYDTSPEYIKKFIEKFNEIAEIKFSHVVILYDKTDKKYRIDMYLGAAEGHRTVIIVDTVSDTFKLTYTDKNYSRTLAVKNFLENFGPPNMFITELKELEPELGNVPWKQSVLYFTSPNEYLDDMAEIIKIINWDGIINTNNRNIVLTVEREADIIYYGAFHYNVKCHGNMIGLLNEFRIKLEYQKEEYE